MGGAGGGGQFIMAKRTGKWTDDDDNDKGLSAAFRFALLVFLL